MIKNEYSYFMDALKKEKCNAAGLVNFTPEFYSTFKAAYIRSYTIGAACYDSVFSYPFYKDNGFYYCLFLEIFQASKTGSEIRKNAKIKRCRHAIKKYRESGMNMAVFHSELLKIFNSLKDAAAFLEENAARIEI